MMDVKLPLAQDQLLPPPSRKNRQFQKLLRYFNEFSSNTSIHGFKYLASGRGCFVEKLWWLAVLCLCTYGCGIYIKRTLEKREDNPVFVSLNPTPMHMWDVPFPAITICPVRKIAQSHFNKTYFTQKLLQENMTAEEMKNFVNSATDCKNSWYKEHLDKLMVDHSFNIDHLDKVSPSLDDTFDFCLSGSKVFNCHEVFSPVLTDLGLCFSLNMVDKSQLLTDSTYVSKGHMDHRKILRWSPDNNYIKTLNETFPMRATSARETLFLILKAKSQQNVCRSYDGFRIILHHPAEIPTLSTRYSVLDYDQGYKIWVKPEVMTTSPKLRDYNPINRGCYFSNEKQLKFYQFYNEGNCKLECIANYTLQLCGCAAFYMPHETNTRLCGFGDKICVNKAKNWFLHMEMELEIFEDEILCSKQEEKFCGCLPSCTSITYNSEMGHERNWSPKTENVSYTQIHVSFKDVKFITMQRNELFSDTDFFANCGGLFSLFTGFSMVSLAEIMYFLTLKWICNLWRFGRRFW